MSMFSFSFCIFALLLSCTSVVSLLLPTHLSKRFLPIHTIPKPSSYRAEADRNENFQFANSIRMSSSISTETFKVDEIPPLQKNPPIKVAVIVEPTPFTHVRLGLVLYLNTRLTFDRTRRDLVVIPIDTRRCYSFSPKLAIRLKLSALTTRRILQRTSCPTRFRTRQDSDFPSTTAFAYRMITSWSG